MLGCTEALWENDRRGPLQTEQTHYEMIGRCYRGLGVLQLPFTKALQFDASGGRGVEHKQSLRHCESGLYVITCSWNMRGPLFCSWLLLHHLLASLSFSDSNDCFHFLTEGKQSEGQRWAPWEEVMYLMFHEAQAAGSVNNGFIIWLIINRTRTPWPKE